MESLLFSLFITHLAVGGELLQYSTDIIYVSKDGTDNNSCLNGDNHCKTLGYVLTNIPMLQCTSCTVMVTYGHVVGPLRNTPYIVNISNVEVLYIVGHGLGQPNLDFNGNTLKLVTRLNTVITTLVIENIKGKHYDLSTEFFVIILKFTMINVMLYNSTIEITAKNTHYQSSQHFNNWIIIKTPGKFIDSEIVILNSSTFKSILEININGYLWNSKSLPNDTVIIRQCRFINVRHNAPSVRFSTSGCAINLTMEENWLDGAKIEFRFYHRTTGSVLIANNHHAFCVSKGFCCMYFIISDDICSASIAMKYYNNTFIDNMVAEILHFESIFNIDIEDNKFINNVVDTSVLSVHVQCIIEQETATLIKNSTFLNNSIRILSTADKGAIVIINIARSNIILSHLNFANNKGTPLSIMGPTVTIAGDIVFSNNNAITGGGMYVSDGYVTVAENATVTFINNVALYGGAIYADAQYCFLDFHYNHSIVFNGNHANIGSSIFSSYDWCSIIKCTAIQNIHVCVHIASLPTNVSFNICNTTSVFLGQIIVGDVTAIDCFGNTSSCLANAFLQCDGKICDHYRIEGPSTVFLSNGTVNTGLIIKISEHASFHQVQLTFICKTLIRQLPLVLNVDVTVLPCPLGFVLNSSTGQCECINNENEYFICNKDVGLVCVKKGYWYSNYSGTASKCIHLFCDYSNQRKACPATVSPDSENYLLLGSSQDDQCIDGHGGTLCTGCALNKLPTYGALQCIDSNKCTRWHPYILILLNIAVPFINGVFLMIVIRLKLSIGSGYLYGPLFYLAVLNLIPLTSYSTLNTIISSFAGTLLLKLKFLGYIPWCFFSSVSLLTSKWFELIGPSVVAVVLLLTVYLARCSPKLLEHFQKSPLQAMCVLVLVLFWSLASTSISVITPVYLSGVEGPRVHLQPDIAYLRGDHIPL